VHVPIKSIGPGLNPGTLSPFVSADEGLFVGKKDEAERMKTLITEPSYRSEKKFCEPH